MTTATFDKDRAVLLLVDVQVDFLPGGALPVEHSDLIIEPLRKLMLADLFRYYVATQDWHPPGHISFASAHPGRAPMETMELYGHPQVLWPDHCVQGTPGAELQATLPWHKLESIIRKGTDPQVDSYSGFRNNWDRRGERPPTGLNGYLKDRRLTDIFVCGLARDVCVKWTAQDAAQAGFRTCLLWDLSASIDPSADTALGAELRDQGIEILTSEQLFRH
ncbi:MAG: nicotinamidase [Gammaproteobacteria bacterium]